MIARGKQATWTSHAFDGVDAERPPIRAEHVVSVLEEPDADDGRCARAWRGYRTILVYYYEGEEEIEVRAVSATRRRLAP